MKKSLCSAILLAVSLVAVTNTQAQQQAGTTTVHGLQKILRNIRPEVRAILGRQQARSSTAAKPASNERLIATAIIIGTGAAAQKDSTTYQYSGNRGSILLNSIYSYSDNYYPISTWAADLYQDDAPRFQHDTSRSYVTDNAGNYFLQYWQSRSYDANNNVTMQQDINLEDDGSQAGHDSLRMSYSAGFELTAAQRYSDTSMAQNGTYQLTAILKALYTAGYRDYDTINQWFGPYSDKTATTYIYSSSDMLDASATQVFDETSMTWEYSDRTLYTYDGSDRLIKDVREHWNGASWELAGTDSFSYTGANTFFNYSEEVYYNSLSTERYVTIGKPNSFGGWDSVYFYDGDLAMVTVNGAFELQYNSNNHLTKITGYNEDGGPFVPVVGRYYYEQSSSIAGPAHSANATFATLSPNPTQNSTALNIAQPKGQAQIAITNMAGQTLYEQSGPATPTVDINTTALPAGVYHVNIRMGNATQTLKLVKQ